MIRLFVAVLMLVVASPALAGPIAIVDFERAVNETDEGQEAQKRLDVMYESRKDEIEKLRTALEADLEDYKSRQLIMSDAARTEAEKKLYEKQVTFEQTYMTYQTEMQQTYLTLLSDLDEKMRTLSAKIAKEQGYDIVIDRAAVVYFGGATIDMTDDLIKRYNAASP